MKNFGRLLQISFFIASMIATVATVSAAGQDASSPADQQATYPADQAPPPSAGQPTDSASDKPSPYPADQAPPPPAGQPTPSGQAGDPPGRVARLEYMTGSVSVQPHGTGDWVQGSTNNPLTNADNVWADKDSRAELNLGTGFMRINSESSLTLTNVSNDAVQVQLHQGTLNVHINKLYGREVYEIDTPNQAFTVTKSGEYRFDVDPNGDTTLVTVWKGEGEATGQGPAVRVHAGQQARFSSGNSLAHQINDAPNPDSFDEWCKTRDRREDNSVSARYVAPGVVGAGDLDEYGSWRDDPQYGNVWVPTSVAPGWAPYHDGHWAWVDPWGWTWVDDAPWGFAPFHYGRWVSFGGYWGWSPGPYWVRPYYAPALVAWFGGPRFGVSFGFGFGGGFGWCPLGFGEPFFPWYGASRGYFRNVNISNTRITNITNITNNYYNNGNRTFGAPYGRNGIGMPRYASKPGAFTAVSRNTLERGLPVSQNAARISPGALRNISAIGRPDISPSRQAMLGPRATARPSAAVVSRPTMSRMTPPATSARPSAMQISRGPAAPVARNNMPTSRAPEVRPSSTVSMPAPAGRYVPRPPQGGVRSFAGPSSNPTARSGGSMPSASPLSRSVPRPPEGSFSRPTMTAHNITPSMPSRPYGSPSYGRSMPNSVPHPTGRITPAPYNYPSARSQGYSARSYGGGGYGGYRGSSAPPSRGSYGGGGRGYSAPSSHSSGSFGGSHGSSGSSHVSSSSHSSSGGSSSHGGHR